MTREANGVNVQMQTFVPKMAMTQGGKTMKSNHNEKTRARHLASIYTEFLQEYIAEVTQEDSPEVKRMAYQLFVEDLTQRDKR